MPARPDANKPIVYDDGKGWERYYNQFPKGRGMSMVSRVGFDRSRTEALLCFGWQSHGLAGTGYCILLRKVDGKWTKVERLLARVS